MGAWISQGTHSGQRDFAIRSGGREPSGSYGPGGASSLPIFAVAEVAHQLEVAGEAALVAERPEAGAREAVVRASASFGRSVAGES